jgi:hypothetical protein
LQFKTSSAVEGEVRAVLLDTGLTEASGCDEMQGVYFAEPLAAGDITRILRDGDELRPFVPSEIVA